MGYSSPTTTLLLPCRTELFEYRVREIRDEIEERVSALFDEFGEGLEN